MRCTVLQWTATSVLAGRLEALTSGRPPLWGAPAYPTSATRGKKPDAALHPDPRARRDRNPAFSEDRLQFPCFACCNAIVQSGITRICTPDHRYWDDDPFDKSHKRKPQVLREAGVVVTAPNHPDYRAPKKKLLAAS